MTIAAIVVAFVVGVILGLALAYVEMLRAINREEQAANR